ncbi:MULTISPECIES: hypothetical protein [Legionella]|uniref:Uncharacterized protein n=1 Tax=Legionella steelei TaxID=947033 RepID=A0A0W0ZDG1_9GAMM|nr:MULTISPECIES: hypothetical protein [Legionella]KTD66846.1 hypothetical protein Lste_3052 [Legionella steelei]MBN9226054.1 hypothetical protein [Legionella steelei]OJW16599.1 MAG: hypothetical protein BGO44_00785 [Legionella sp. 39-23]
MAYIKFNQVTEARSKIMARLSQLGLEPDEDMMHTLEANPQYLNRLTSLFKALKKYNIALNDKLHKTIASNAANAGYVVHLLEFMHEAGIDTAIIAPEVLFQVAKSETTLIHGIRQLIAHNAIGTANLKLMFSYPEQSYLLADLIINFQAHAYPTEKIVEKLGKFHSKKMNTVIELLTLLLNKNLYYSECLDIFLAQQEHISNIYEGAKKLAVENKLAASYLDTIGKAPKNANILANIILLLHSTSLIDYKKTEDLLIASRLGAGAFHLLMHLQQAGILDAEHYKKVCQHNPILNKPEVIESLSNLPLFVAFEKGELEQMLILITKEPGSDTDCNELIEMIQKHVLTITPHL